MVIVERDWELVEGEKVGCFVVVMMYNWCEAGVVILVVVVVLDG